MDKKYHLYLRGYTGGWDFDADYVDYILAQNQGKQVNVLISSPGGSLATALRISAAFAAHGDVHVHYVGMNASAATIAGMGAKEATIDDVGAVWLVHKSCILLDIFQQMNSDDMSVMINSLQKRIEDHEKIDAQIAKIYAKRCKRSPEDLANLMSKETWLSPEEALEWGFVDALVETGKEKEERLPESVVCAIREAGLPELPRKYRQSTMSEKITESVRSALEACGIKRPQKEDKNQLINNSKSSKSMEGKSTITNQQRKNSENIKSKDSDKIASLEAKLEKAEARIKELENQPGTETNNVIDESGSRKSEGTSVDEFFSNVSGARDLLNSIGR
ncbi:MAG: Clp protease ClpP [Muribaculaceae bacterium]|nr:Clp protease ClpP [Muribaculaceae bacterium]